MKWIDLSHQGLALLLALAVLTGFSAQAMLFESPFVSDVAESSSPDVETATAFYRALDDAMRGEGTDALSGLLADLFVDHDSQSGAARSRADFLASFDLPGETRLPLGIEVLAIEPAGQSVIAHIQMERASQVELAGLSVEQAAHAPQVEVLRVDQGRILDRWAADARGLDVARPNVSSNLVHVFTGAVTTLERLELGMTTDYAWTADGAAMVIVESGAALLQISTRERMADPVELPAGTVRAIAHGDRARLRAADGGSASVLLYRASREVAYKDAQPMRVPPRANEPDVATLLWRGLLGWTNVESIHRPARLVLPAGSSIELSRPAGSALLIGADSGLVEVQIPGGGVETVEPGRLPKRSEGMTQIDASRAGWIVSDGDVTLWNRSDQPVALTMIVITTATAQHAPEEVCVRACLSP
jgi:hypothetical protein